MYQVGAYLYAVPVMDIEEDKLNEAIKKVIRKKGFLSKTCLEDVMSRWKIWVPYFRFEYEMECEEKEKKETREIALNAMLYSSLLESDVTLHLFKPSYLRYVMKQVEPDDGDLVGDVMDVDLDAILYRMFSRYRSIKDELAFVNSKLRKEQIKMKRMMILLPSTPSARRKLDVYMTRTAKLRALRFAMDVFFEFNENVTAINVIKKSLFYYPNLIITLLDKEDGTIRHVVMELGEESGKKRIMQDEELSHLCTENEIVRILLEKNLGLESSEDISWET